MLRSFRLGEADRVLHLYTLERGRIGAVAKGIRKTKSRFGARLEPLSHVDLMLHQGAGELQTVTGVQLIRSHHEVREQQYRLGVGLLGAEAMLRLFTEQEGNERAFQALTRFLGLVEGLEPRSDTRGVRPARALVSAQAALALRLPAAPDELRRLWLRDRAARRLLAGSGWRGVQELQRRRARALAGRDHGNRGAPRAAARRGGRRRPRRTLGPRCSRRDHVRVRILRELPAAHAAQRLALLRRLPVALERGADPVGHAGDRQPFLRE